ncbi:MAG TPA: protoporphyrinogen oxidase [Thermoanaerobaculia bacterium]|nr:protoporphyrinogen oxidase [Thermoanaerobaculia bacterium]
MITSPGGKPLDAVVIGAGISGLTTAFYLERGGLDVALLEAAGRVGGSIRTLHDGPWLFELGPSTVLDGNPAVGRLLEDAGLAGARRQAATAGGKRYVWKAGRLVPLPGGPLGFLSTPLFRAAAKWRLLKEPWVGRSADLEGESIASFVRRRLGADFLDYAVGPFVSGVYAGDPERLSVAWAVPKIAALEREHGSLIRGAIAKRKGAAPRGAMISLPEGLLQLPLELGQQLHRLHLDTAAASVHPDGDALLVATNRGPFRARRVVLAVPSEVAARLLATATGGQSQALAEVPYSPVVVFAYGFRREQVAHPLDGFGFLAPRVEGLRLLGCLFSSTLFPGRVATGCVGLTAFAGGRTDPELVGLGDDELHHLALGDLGRTLGVSGPPVYRHLARWPRAIPQYELGHGRFAELADRLEARLPGLYLRGNFLGGISLPDCIANAATLARKILALEGPCRV